MARRGRRSGTRRLAEGIGAGGPLQEDRYWGMPAAGVEEDFYWRRLSDNWYQKDVLPGTYLEIHNQCYEAYNANPLANYIVELTTNFVLGPGIAVAAREPAVQAIVDAFWDDPDNHMATRVYSLCTELSLYGELFIRFFVNPFSGAVKIAQIDPSLIDQIETDPENIERPLRFHQRPVGPGTALWSTQTPPAGGGIGAPGPDSAGVPSGGEGSAGAELGQGAEAQGGIWYGAASADGRPEVVQVKINCVSNAKRGKSDLATLLPWLRRYKDWLTDRVRINKYKAAFLWDVQLSGADAKTIDRKRMQYAYPPEPGSIIVHNESEQWSAVGPRIEAGDAAADGKAIKMMVAMGAGLPEHYLLEGGDVNRATATAMGLPTFRKFQRRQDTFGLLVRCIVDRALIDAVGRTARGAPDGPDNADTTLDEAARSLGAYGVGACWTSSFAEALAAPWAICLVDGAGLAPAQYPAEWFGPAVGGGNHFILWLPAWQGSADWYDDPLAYFNGQQDCRYDRSSVAASFYGAYLLPDTGHGEVAPSRGAIIARCALKVRPDHRCLALADLAAGTAVTVLAGVSGAWRQVGAAGKIGWVLGANVAWGV